MTWPRLNDFNFIDMKANDSSKYYHSKKAFIANEASQ